LHYLIDTRIFSVFQLGASKTCWMKSIIIPSMLPRSSHVTYCWSIFFNLWCRPRATINCLKSKVFMRRDIYTTKIQTTFSTSYPITLWVHTNRNRLKSITSCTIWLFIIVSHFILPLLTSSILNLKYDNIHVFFFAWLHCERVFGALF